jgi:large subunit ribosomal protein L4e
LFGSYRNESLDKAGYHLQRNVMTCADLARIINSDQVQSKLRDVRKSVRTHDKTKKNPLKNKAILNRLNPFAKKQAEILAKQDKERHAKRAAALKAKKSKAGKKEKAARTKGYQALQDGLKASFKTAEDLIAEEERAGNYVPGETDEEDE